MRELGLTRLVLVLIGKARIYSHRVANCHSHPLLSNKYCIAFIFDQCNSLRSPCFT